MNSGKPLLKPCIVLVLGGGAHFQKFAARRSKGPSRTGRSVESAEGQGHVAVSLAAGSDLGGGLVRDRQAHIAGCRK